MKKSIVEKNPANRCFICGKCGYLERHHIFGAANKKLSEKYGLTVHLCYECHRDNKLGVHGDAELMRRLHEVGQAAFDKKYGHGEFEKIFKKNYMNREETER